MQRSCKDPAKILQRSCKDPAKIMQRSCKDPAKKRNNCNSGEITISQDKFASNSKISKCP
jgi:hypothetical protein